MRATLLLLALTLLTGCASIVTDSEYPIAVTSTPPGATYDVLDQDGKKIYTGTTPGSVTLTAGEGYFDGATYTFAFRKEGYQEARSSIDSSMDGWYWGNLAFGGVIGMLIVDPLTGAMYKLPNKAHGDLFPVPAAPAPVQASASGQLTKDQQVEQLQREGLSYEEYMRRYKAIMAQ